jgi:hypothetical protein
MRPWIHNQGLANKLNYALDEFEAMKRLVCGLENIEVYGTALRSLIRETNERLFRLVEDSSSAFERGDRSTIDADAVRAYCEEAEAQLIQIRNTFVAENILRLVDQVSPDSSNAPVMAPQVH